MNQELISIGQRGCCISKLLPGGLFPKLFINSYSEAFAFSNSVQCYNKEQNGWPFPVTSCGVVLF